MEFRVIGTKINFEAFKYYTRLGGLLSGCKLRLNTKIHSAVDADKKAESEVGNLEQAWEMFELCKIIWGKANNVARECEALICLGEVSMENENYAQAVEDITACLAKRIAALPSDSRCLVWCGLVLTWS